MKRFGTLLMLLTGCLASNAHAQAACSCMEGSVDEHERLCLPALIDGFESKPIPLERRAVIKAHRNSVGGGYNGPAHRLAITVYFYDREGSDDQADAKEMQLAVAEIQQVRRGARVETGGKGSLPLAGTPTEAHGRLFTWRDGGDDYASYLWLIPRTSRWIKVRGTYVRPIGGEGEAMRLASTSIRTVLRSICRLP